MVEKEKERLIKEHSRQLEGFLHPDLVERAKKIANYQENPGKTGYLSNFKAWYLYFLLRHGLIFLRIYILTH